MMKPSWRGPLEGWRTFTAWLSERGPNQRRSAYLFIAAVLVLAAGIGAALGFALAKTGAVWWVRTQIGRVATEISGPLRTVPIEWSRQTTEFHELSIARLPIGQAWNLAELDNHIVFASRSGALAYLTGGRVAGVGISAPLGLQAYARSEFAQQDTIDSNQIHVTDLLVQETAPHRFELYVAHIRYREACFRLVVSKIALTASDTAISPASDWQSVFETRDCIGLRATGFPYLSPSSGGRLVQLDDETLALSTGDFEFVGAEGDRAVSDDPNSDLGKIIVFSLRTGHSRVFAQGLRNPQGLMLSRAGVLWETEHGPQGGDELNIIREGADYGWPRVSYGVPYGGAMAPSWPAEARQGMHDGYERPRFVFTPAIGISNLIEPDLREFPEWVDSLLVASLRGQALHLLRLEGDRVEFDEPIAFPGHRIRDLITLADGRIAFSTDEGDLFLITNAATDTRPHPQVLTGLETLPPAPETVYAGAYYRAHFFATQCGQCHALNGQIRQAPPLNGIVGRRVGSFPGYAYSPGLSGRQERWTKARLLAFLRDPAHTYPGTTMPPPGNAEVLPAIVDYLADYRGPTRDAPR